MSLTQPGKWGPEALQDTAGNQLVGATVTVPAGYTASLDADWNCTVIGPPADDVTVTVKVGGVTVRTLHVVVQPQVAELAAAVTSTQVAAAAASDALDAATTAQSTAEAAQAVAASAAATLAGIAETIRDTVGAALVAGSGVTISVNDAGDTITISSPGSEVQSVSLVDDVPANNNSTALQDVLEWTFPVDVGRYLLAGVVNYTGDSTADAKFTVVGPGGTSYAGRYNGPTLGATNNAGGRQVPPINSASPNAFGAYSAPAASLDVEAYLTVTTPGTVVFRFAQNIATDVSTTETYLTLLAGSTLTLAPLPS